MRRRRRLPRILLPISLVFIIGLLLFWVGSLLFSSERSAKAVVEDFYTYEAEGAFSDSWELLHPFMKERFAKAAYTQDRSHVFNGHFGAETFTYTINDGEEITGWKMEESRAPFDTAYHYIVTQHYNGKYGKFNFQQDVYVVKNQDEGNWQILWDYNK